MSASFLTADGRTARPRRVSTSSTTSMDERLDETSARLPERLHPVKIAALARRFRLRLLFALGALLVVAIMTTGSRHAVSLLQGNIGSSVVSYSNVCPPSGQIRDHAKVPMTLSARLAHLVNRPVLSQWEAELTNRHACPMRTFDRDDYFFNHNKVDQWRAVSVDDIRLYRRLIVEYFESIEEQGIPTVWSKEMEAQVPKDRRRGIIMSAGDRVSR